jgi:Na+-driven multidrug efflux pump
MVSKNIFFIAASISAGLCLSQMQPQSDSEKARDMVNRGLCVGLMFGYALASSVLLTHSDFPTFARFAAA